MTHTELQKKYDELNKDFCSVIPPGWTARKYVAYLRSREQVKQSLLRWVQKELIELDTKETDAIAFVISAETGENYANNTTPHIVDRMDNRVNIEIEIDIKELVMFMKWEIAHIQSEPQEGYIKGFKAAIETVKDYIETYYHVKL